MAVLIFGWLVHKNNDVIEHIFKNYKYCYDYIHYNSIGEDESNCYYVGKILKNATYNQGCICGNLKKEIKKVKAEEKRFYKDMKKYFYNNPYLILVDY